MGPREAVLEHRQSTQAQLAPDEIHFRCEKLNCTLHREQCGKRFIRAAAIVPHPERGIANDERPYIVCQKCEIGERHSAFVVTPLIQIKTVRLGHAAVKTAA